MPRPHRTSRSLSLCLGTLILFAVGTASADDFARRCNELSRDVKIQVNFQDREVATDESRTVQALNQMSGKRSGSSHNVYGLTRATPLLRLEVTPRAIADSDGRVCAIPDISVILGFSELEMYLAMELTDLCRKQVIREHEEEHVKTWRAHLRVSASLLANVLQREVGESRIYGSREAAELGVRAWAYGMVNPWAKRIADIVISAQQAIDTPTSYALVAARLRACAMPRR